MELYENLWKPRAIKHDQEAHQQRIRNAQKDPSCIICNPVTDTYMNEDQNQKFALFWEWFKEAYYAMSYTGNTLKYFKELLRSEVEYARELTPQIMASSSYEVAVSASSSRMVKNRVEKVTKDMVPFIGTMRYEKTPPASGEQMIKDIREFVMNAAMKGVTNEALREFQNYMMQELI